MKTFIKTITSSNAFASADRVARDLADLKHTVSALRFSSAPALIRLQQMQEAFAAAAIEIAELQVTITEGMISSEEAAS